MPSSAMGLDAGFSSSPRALSPALLAGWNSGLPVTYSRDFPNQARGGDLGRVGDCRRGSDPRHAITSTAGLCNPKAGSASQETDQLNTDAGAGPGGWARSIIGLWVWRRACRPPAAPAGSAVSALHHIDSTGGATHRQALPSSGPLSFLRMRVTRVSRG